MAKQATITNQLKRGAVIEFVATAREWAGSKVQVADLSLAKQLGTMQSRSGKLGSMTVLAVAWDDFGTTVLTSDMRVLQLDAEQGEVK